LARRHFKNFQRYKQIGAEKMRVNDFPALKVRYRTESGEEMECIYVAAGSLTVAVQFSGHLSGGRPSVPLERLPNYRSYLQMVDTLRITLP